VRVRDLDSKAILDAVNRKRIDWGIAGYHRLPYIDAEPLFSERQVCLISRSDRNLSPAAQQFARVMRDIIARRAAD
jgi:DNA-binding transcriptional LysR family regulator